MSTSNGPEQTKNLGVGFAVDQTVSLDPNAPEHSTTINRELKMKKMLMTSSAAIALLAGASLAIAQDATKGAGGAGGPPTAGAGAGAGPAGDRGGATTPSAKDLAPGRAAGSATESAPGQKKLRGETAKDEAPGQLKRGAEGKSDANPGKAAKNDGDKGDASGTAGDKSMKTGKEQTGAKSNDSSEGASEGTAGSGAGKPGGGNLADIPQEKKAQVRSAFGKHRVEPAKNINISVNVGVAVPRSLTLYVVPQDIVVIYPAYRTYKYFVYDDRVVIVDPNTYEIVEVIIIV